MDQFGIGNAMVGMANAFFISARRTGRTTSMLDSLKDGDRIVFTNPSEARRVERMLKERNLKVECVVIPSNDPGRVFSYPTPQGRTVFDHSWVEEFYMDAITRAQKDIDHLQTESSGYGEAHLQTARQAAELAKWR